MIVATCCILANALPKQIANLWKTAPVHHRTGAICWSPHTGLRHLGSGVSLFGRCCSYCAVSPAQRK